MKQRLVANADHGLSWEPDIYEVKDVKKNKRMKYWLIVLVLIGIVERVTR